jgi:hypothetical protein
MMTPENVIPVMEYTAQYAPTTEEDKDHTLLELMEEIDQLKELSDVRPSLAKRFKVRQLLRNSKLI